MCGVIGALIKSPSVKDFEALKRVFIESKIRGMHATGISFIPSWSNGDIVTIKESIPADQFVEKHMHNDNFKSFLNEDGNLYMIGHCRYSTSDLEYNQPLGDLATSIVHNGVITQELPENWETLYGYKTMTKNDSELIVYSDDPLTEFSHMSMAVCELVAAKKELTLYRNGKRPIYLTTMTNGVIITSTEDIPKRAGLYLPTMEAPVNTYITFGEDLKMTVKVANVKDTIDYQKR